MAAGPGLEPGYQPPKGRVLPLDDPAILLQSIISILKIQHAEIKAIPPLRLKF